MNSEPVYTVWGTHQSPRIKRDYLIGTTNRDEAQAAYEAAVKSGKYIEVELDQNQIILQWNKE